MSVDLYEHQKKAVEELENGSILCGGVGTGKSRTALAYYHKKICGGKLPRRGSSEPFDPGKRVPLYIITTARKRDSLEWEQECLPFLLNPTDYVVDSWNNIKKYTDVEDSFFIFDEQRLVGSGAWVKAFLKIVKKNSWILLTATPGDTWLDYCPVFIANGFYKNRTQFISEHVVYHRYAKFPKVERYIGTHKLERLRCQIVVPMEFHKVATQHHEWVKVGYDEELYERTIKQRWDIYKNEPLKDASALCYLLRRIVNSDRRRLVALDNIVKRHPKAIVFYNFDYELEMLRYYGDTTNIEYAEWNGHRHQPIPKNTSWLYFVQYNAGGEGWNCIETDTTIFFAQNYSYRMTVQASGRIDRMNTPYRDLYYYHFFSDSKIDKAIKACLEKKKDFNEKTFAKSALEEIGLMYDDIYEKGEQLLLF